MHFIVPVWGADYIEVFLRGGLPSQLAAGNLPAIPASDRRAYHIFTRAQDLALFDHMDVIERLRTLVPVHFHVIDATSTSVHEVMSEAYRRGLVLAHIAGDQAVPLTPDLVFANGAFAWMYAKRQRGARIVLLAVLRATGTEVMPQLKLAAAANGGVVEIAPCALVNLALRFLHSLTRNHYWKGSGRLHPANLIWPVGDEGVLLHAFHLHPLFVQPNASTLSFAGTLDEDLVILAEPEPSKVVVATDSDEMFALELCHPARTTPLNAREESIADVAAWTIARAEPWHCDIARRSIRLHRGDCTEVLWARVEKEGSSVLQAVLCRADKTPLLQWIRWPIASLRRLVRRANWAHAYRARGLIPDEQTGLPRSNVVFSLLARCYAIYRRMKWPSG